MKHYVKLKKTFTGILIYVAAISYVFDGKHCRSQYVLF